jgi:hypothetical protein
MGDVWIYQEALNASVIEDLFTTSMFISALVWHVYLYLYLYLSISSVSDCVVLCFKIIQVKTVIIFAVNVCIGVQYCTSNWYCMSKQLPSFTVHYFISAMNRALLQCLLHLHISTKIVYGLNFSPQQPAWLWHIARISTRVPSALGNPLSVCTLLSFDKDSSLLGYDTLWSHDWVWQRAEDMIVIQRLGRLGGFGTTCKNNLITPLVFEKIWGSA